MELLSALGLNVQILIAQFVNFAVLLFVLWKFGYKPMLKMLEERRKKIEKGVSDAELATKKLFEAEEKEIEVISKAKREALALIDKAKKEAGEKKNEIVASAKEEIGIVINQEKEKIQAEKAELLKSVKREVSSLVMISLEKVLKEKIDGKKDEALIKKVVRELK